MTNSTIKTAVTVKLLSLQREQVFPHFTVRVA